jgi:hypothetical protein
VTVKRHISTNKLYEIGANLKITDIVLKPHISSKQAMEMMISLGYILSHYKI